VLVSGRAMLIESADPLHMTQGAVPFTMVLNSRKSVLEMV